jgi:hypothetical protein
VSLPDWLCQVVGVATHYFWLLVALGQNVCTFHMFYTLAFPLQSHVTMASPRKMTRRYLLYVFSVATTTVLAVLCWQFIHNGRSGYGGTDCYISTALVRISMFAAPLGATVVTNIVMFIVTIVRLRSLQPVESTRSNRLSLFSYTKLSVFTGVTWLFGFLGSFLNSDPLNLIYVIFQGLQGFFIFLAFLANARVVSMLKERCWGSTYASTASKTGSPSRTKTTRIDDSHAHAKHTISNGEC